MNDIATLRVENARLRYLLEEHGIDPDPRPPEPERFGPPTEIDWKMQWYFARAAEKQAVETMRMMADMVFRTGENWPVDEQGCHIGPTLRIRLPANFTANLVGSDIA